MTARVRFSAYVPLGNTNRNPNPKPKPLRVVNYMYMITVHGHGYKDHMGMPMRRSF